MQIIYIYTDGLSQLRNSFLAWGKLIYKLQDQQQAAEVY